MGVLATSFSSLIRPGGSPASAARTVQQAVARTSDPALVLTFLSGRAAVSMDEFARRLSVLLGTQAPPVILAAGPGVLTQEGELEGESALAGIVIGRLNVELETCEQQLNAHNLARLLGGSERRQPRLLVLRSEGFEPDMLWAARDACENPGVFGGGTYGAPGLSGIIGGSVQRLSGCAIRMRGLSSIVRTAHSCRLLGPLLPITRAEGSMVLELDGQPALRVLEKLGNAVSGRPLLFTMLADHQEVGQAPDLLVRGIQGIDPARGGLLVGKEIEEGRCMTFAVRDARAARDGFETLCRNLQRDLAGAVPRFGLYFNCSGRGQSLHDVPHVDTRILRERFAQLPVAGLQSAFEIAPYAGRPAVQLYTGVLSVFCSPS